MEKGIIKTPDDRLMSEVFNYLRFPLIVGVVFIHNYSPSITIGNLELGSIEDMTIYHYISTLFSQVIARIAVPLFFLMSGYLFFYKVENFNNKLYLQKLRKRFRSLMIPFLFWTTALLFIYYVMSNIPITAKFFSSPTYTYKYILSSYWSIPNDDGSMTYPLAYQFWFIRDLIICVVISPLLYYLVTKGKYIGIILLGIAWFIGLSIPYIGIRGFNTAAIFFFSLGAWCSCHKFNIIVLSRQLKFFGYEYPIIAFIDVMTKDYYINPYIHNLGILTGIIFCFLITSYLLERNKIHPVPLLSSASFFIFAIHDPWILTQIKKLLYGIVKPQSDLTFTLLYFIIVILVVSIALGIYYILKKITPSFTSIITGGR